MGSVVPHRVLILAGSPETRAELEAKLRGRGYQLFVDAPGPTATRALCRTRMHLVVLDVRGPGADEAWKLCAQIPAVFRAVLVAIVEDRLEGMRALELGADNTVVCGGERDALQRELPSVVRSLLNRIPLPDDQQPSTRPRRHINGGLLICWDTHEVWADGRRVNLTPKEYSLLAFMVENVGQIVSHQQMLLGGLDEPASDDPAGRVKGYIHRVRHKIEQDPKSPAYIVTHWGAGYQYRRVDDRAGD
jgi:DNA-binding response OmpR family regulator